MEYTGTTGQYCTTCGQRNPTQARFCARCGTALTEIAGVASTPAASASPTPVTAESRISGVSAVIGVFPIGLVIGLLLMEVVNDVRYGGGGSFILLAVFVGMVTGVAAALVVSQHLGFQGRPASAVGMVLMMIGWGLLLSYYYELSLLLDIVEPDYGDAWIITSFTCFGAGAGFAFPMAFWRELRKSRTLGRRFGVAGLASLALGALLDWGSRIFDMTILVPFFALLIALPLVLISPIVRKA